MGLNISELKGKTLKEICVGDNNEEIIFKLYNGGGYKMFHSQNSNESVTIADIIGDLNDLIGSPIVLAEESFSKYLEACETEPPDPIRESFTWTFYKLATVKGYVTIRWFGTSNGYYSESVLFQKIND